MIWKTSTVLSLAVCVLSLPRNRLHQDLSHIGHQKPEHHDGYAWTYPSYEFSYKVDDPDSHDKKGQHEHRSGDNVIGNYWLIQPDGEKRYIKYHVDDKSGFIAVINYTSPHSRVYYDAIKKRADADKKEEQGKQAQKDTFQEDKSKQIPREEKQKKDISENQKQEQRDRVVSHEERQDQKQKGRRSDDKENDRSGEDGEQRRQSEKQFDNNQSEYRASGNDNLDKEPLWAGLKGWTIIHDRFKNNEKPVWEWDFVQDHSWPGPHNWNDNHGRTKHYNDKNIQNEIKEVRKNNSYKTNSSERQSDGDEEKLNIKKGIQEDEKEHDLQHDVKNSEKKQNFSQEIRANRYGKWEEGKNKQRSGDNNRRWGGGRDRPRSDNNEDERGGEDRQGNGENKSNDGKRHQNNADRGDRWRQPNNNQFKPISYARRY